MEQMESKNNENWLDQLGRIIDSQREWSERQPPQPPPSPVTDPASVFEIEPTDSEWTGTSDSSFTLGSPTPIGYSPMEGYDFDVLKISYISEEADRLARSILSRCVCDFCGEPFQPPYDAYGDVSIGIYCSHKCTDRGIRAYVKAIINIRRYGIPPPP